MGAAASTPALLNNNHLPDPTTSDTQPPAPPPPPLLPPSEDPAFDLSIVTVARLPLCTVRVSRLSEISSLLARVATTIRLPPSSLRLSCKGEWLHAGGRVGEYSLSPGDEIILHVRGKPTPLAHKTSQPAFTFGGERAGVLVRVHSRLTKKLAMVLSVPRSTRVGQLGEQARANEGRGVAS